MRDFTLCEHFKWDLETLYKQPRKRVEEFLFVLIERKKHQKTLDDQEANKK